MIGPSICVIIAIPPPKKWAIIMDRQEIKEMKAKKDALVFVKRMSGDKFSSIAEYLGVSQAVTHQRFRRAVRHLHDLKVYGHETPYTAMIIAEIENIGNEICFDSVISMEREWGNKYRERSIKCREKS